MADYFIGPDGSDSNDGLSAAQAWATIGKVNSTAADGDTLTTLDGVIVAPTNFHSLSKRVAVSSLNAPQTSWQANASYTGRIWFNSGTQTTGTITYTDQVWDGESGRVSTGFELGSSDTNSQDVTLDSCVFSGTSVQAILISAKRGSLTLTDVSISGDGTSGLSSGNTIGDITTAPYTLTVNGLALDLTSSETTIRYGLLIKRSTSALSAVSADISGVTGTMATSGATATWSGIQVQGIDDAVVEDCAFTVNGNGSFGVKVFGVTGASANDARIQNIKLAFGCTSGYGILLGEPSSADSNMTGGQILGCNVTGQYFTGATPHNICLGRGTSGTCQGNVSRDGYVGILVSMTTTATVTGNVMPDCYGPNIYAKGTTAATIRGNICTLSGKFQQRTNGILAATYQDTTDCTAVTFDSNIVIVADISKIHSLAQITGLAATPATPQPATFTNNTYIIPDTVDLSTADLFTYTGAIGTAKNQTFAEWIANAEVTGDQVIQLPVAEIRRLISGGGSDGLIKPFVSDLVA